MRWTEPIFEPHPPSAVAGIMYPSVRSTAWFFLKTLVRLTIICSVLVAAWAFWTSTPLQEAAGIGLLGSVMMLALSAFRAMALWRHGEATLLLTSPPPIGRAVMTTEGSNQ